MVYTYFKVNGVLVPEKMITVQGRVGIVGQWARTF